MPSHSNVLPPLYLYARISDPDQRKGGGLIRQTDEETQATIKEFCRLFGFRPSKEILVDDGVSAWKGLNATPNHELGKFLDRAKRGLIPAGACLLIENYDRLSRQNPWAAISLVNDLRELKIHIGRLDTMRLLRYDSEDHGDFLDCAVTFMRANNENNEKSRRICARWHRKRKAAREAGETMTLRLPAWIRVVDGQRELIPEKAATIRRIFHLAGQGYGHALILKRFAQEGVPPIGKGDHWARSYLAQLLHDRRVLGELQPRLSTPYIKGEKRPPDGEIMKDYYPAVITEEEWHAARAGARQRRTHRGRHAKHTINVFAGLLKNALEGDKYYAVTRSAEPAQNRVLINRNSVEGRSAVRSFPFVTFERAILQRLREINPRELLEGAKGHGDLERLETEFGAIEAEIAEAKDWMRKHKFSPTIAERIADLEARRTEVGGRLAEARERASHPLSASWGECKTLLGILDTAPDPDEVRLRLQSILRRIVESIHLVVVPRGRDRLAAVQIWFAGGKRHRDYLILHRQATANANARKPGYAKVKDFAKDAAPGELDLRQRDHAAKLESWLVAENVETLAARMTDLERAG